MYTKETREKLLKGLFVTVLGRSITIQGSVFSPGMDKFFLKESQSGYNDFLQAYTPEILEEIRNKLAPYLETDTRYANGVFPYCDSKILVARIIEYVLATYCPGEIKTESKLTVKRGKFAMKFRKKAVF